ncbi:hypothetical protein E2C01_030767 [Portunus trituberculatus]|uniref:Uncharacterized protein n=1 Tax=Portunus trituberculatus TaxID=210409 RepID=A0A5B7EWQ2_PORTR|nr:hypothetical protein [Portunus trituberculatus]
MRTDATRRTTRTALPARARCSGLGTWHVTGWLAARRSNSQNSKKAVIDQGKSGGTTTCLAAARHAAHRFIKAGTHLA